MTVEKHNDRKSNTPFIFLCVSIGAFLGLIFYVKDWI